MRLDRQQTAMLLLAQAPALQCQIVKAHRAYTYSIEIAGVLYKAVVLSRSSDYYEKRINLQSASLTLVICAMHDSCLPISVLDLAEGYQNAPMEVPKWYTPEKRFTSAGSHVLVGQLLCGVQSAYELIEGLPRATGYRYLARMREYLSQRQGRPIAV